ncbi:MAG TPA: hypothetical protein VIQ29_16260 [Ancylobacter sp.]
MPMGLAAGRGGSARGAGRFVLYTLKALAFIHLRQDRPQEAYLILDALRRLDPTGRAGGR